MRLGATCEQERLSRLVDRLTPGLQAPITSLFLRPGPTRGGEGGGGGGGASLA